MKLSCRATLSFGKHCFSGDFSTSIKNICFFLKFLSSYQYTGMKAVYFTSRHLQAQCEFVSVIFSNSNCTQDVRPKYFQVSSSNAESSKKVVKIDCLKIYIINTFSTFTIPYRFWPHGHFLPVHTGRSLQITALLEIRNLLPLSKLNEHTWIARNSSNPRQTALSTYRVSQLFLYSNSSYICMFFFILNVCIRMFPVYRITRDLNL